MIRGTIQALDTYLYLILNIKPKMFAKQISLLLVLQCGLINAYSINGPKYSKNKGLKFRAPPAKSDGPTRQLPNKASWLPASLTTPKANGSMMNPLQTRPTALSQKRASDSRLFFTSNKMQSETALTSKGKQVNGRANLSLFSSLSNAVDKINTRNQSRSLTSQMKSIVSQRKTNARLGTLLKVATVFEETLCTEERMAAIRSEFDISDSMVADKFEVEVDGAFEKTEIKLELGEGTEKRSGFRLAGLANILRGNKAAQDRSKMIVPAKIISFAVPIPPPSVAGDYLLSLSIPSSVSGYGIRSHVDALNSSKPSAVSGPGISGYLDALAVTSATRSSRRGPSKYLDTL